MTQRRQLRLFLAAFAALFVAIVLIDALDLFSDKDWSEIPHGSHSHFVSNNRDEGVSASDCPQRPPADNEILSQQCQLIELVEVDGQTHYVPVDRNPNTPVSRFPTQPPGSGVVITPTGQLAAADAH